MAWPFTGREAELRLVQEALEQRSSGGVVIAGPAGVGKTRLASEAAERARARGCAVAWVWASRSARSLPLGAFAPVLPGTDRLPTGGVELLARARQALAEQAAGRRLVVCVDDGQLLDDASAALVHQLVAAREAFAVVTVRRDEEVPDALRALWKDDLCVLLELGELSREEVATTLAAALGGTVDGRSVNALWELTRGNALFLRELLRHGVDHGLLTRDGAIWRWRGAVRAGTRLAEIVDVRVGEAGASGRGVLDVIVVGAPLEVGLLDPEETLALEALERRELVEGRLDGRRRLVDVAHPLHGEAVRAALTPTRVGAIRTRLADAVQGCGARRGGDTLRVAVWRLEAGADGDPELFTHAAERALAAADVVLAARLARAAVQAGGGFAARLALARALANTGRTADAHRLLADLATEAGDDRAATAVALSSARNLFWGLDRADEADGVLRDAERLVRDADLQAELRAQRLRLTAARGNPVDALAEARPLLADVSVHERARMTVVLGAVEALFTTGRTDEALALVEAWLPAAVRLRDELPHAEAVLLGMRALALRLAGRLVEATAFSENAYALLLPRRSAHGTAVEAASLGLIWLARGRVRTALRFSRESAALLRDGDAVGMRAFALAGVAQAAGEAGDAAATRAALVEMDATPLGHKGFAVELELARAWDAAVHGELSRARRHAREAAALAEAREQAAFAVRALHVLLRLGDAAGAAPALARLAASVDGPLVGTAAAHAEAHLARDGARLLEVAERFAAADALLVAAEAAHAAAAAHRDAGRPSSARAAAARGAFWLATCEGARPPTLLDASEAADLTAREREIALLAARGASSREIAARLVLSVRTVDNHLRSAYRKLGVTRRQDLADVLGRTTAEPSGAPMLP